MNIVSQVRIENLEQGIQQQLDKCLIRVDDILSDTATVIHAEAKRTSSFIDKTGNLRRSIRKLKSKFADGGYIIVASGRNVKGGEKGYHAHLIEFGHVKVLWGSRTGERVPARPFMRPAAEKGKSYLAMRSGR
jgi:hypothetical protein